MANKQYVCCYQDCPLCGDKGKKLKKLIFDKQLDVRKVSFASPEGKELCHEAVFTHGIKKMPFFTDGKTFTTALEELIKTESVEKSKKTSTKRRKTKKVEVENESV